jgi:hypothetical protein
MSHDVILVGVIKTSNIECSTAEYFIVRYRIEGMGQISDSVVVPVSCTGFVLLLRKVT